MVVRWWKSRRAEEQKEFAMAPYTEPGDLIEISRPLGYKHWAVYVSDGDVIHLITDSSAGFSSGSSSSGSSVGEDKGKVKREKLKDVVGQDEYRINNLLDEQYNPRPIEEILRDAQSRVGKILPYNVLKNNCEHFVTLLRYGKPESQQAEQVENWFVAALILAAVVFGISVVATVTGKKKQKEKK